MPLDAPKEKTLKGGGKSYWKGSSAAGLAAALTFSAQLRREIDPGRSFGVPGHDIYQKNAGALAIFFGTE